MRCTGVRGATRTRHRLEHATHVPVAVLHQPVDFGRPHVVLVRRPRPRLVVRRRMDRPVAVVPRPLVVGGRATTGAAVGGQQLARGAHRGPVPLLDGVLDVLSQGGAGLAAGGAVPVGIVRGDQRGVLPLSLQDGEHGHAPLHGGVHGRIDPPLAATAVRLQGPSIVALFGGRRHRVALQGARPGRAQVVDVVGVDGFGGAGRVAVAGVPPG